MIIDSVCSFRFAYLTYTERERKSWRRRKKVEGEEREVEEEKENEKMFEESCSLHNLAYYISLFIPSNKRYTNEWNRRGIITVRNRREKFNQLSTLSFSLSLLFLCFIISLAHLSTLLILPLSLSLISFYSNPHVFTCILWLFILISLI